MPRKPLFETDTFPYHIMNRSNNKEFFYLDKKQLWLIFVEVLSKIHKTLGCEMHFFVLMSNHYHLIMSTPNLKLTEAMTYLHREVAKEANRRMGRVNHFFGGRYKWCVVDNDGYYWNVVKYVLRNPVEAGICKNVEEYPFSSINDCKNSIWKMSDIFEDRSKKVELNLDWLNKSYKEEENDAIRKALRRRNFVLPVCKNGKQRVLGSMQRKKGLGTSVD
ncbi:MAG: transposase [Bdellovibrionaceae bacterium]|nr:transposase [Pseudobdellovibrionaceae bacterium]